MNFSIFAFFNFKGIDNSQFFKIPLLLLSTFNVKVFSEFYPIGVYLKKKILFFTILRPLT